MDRYDLSFTIDYHAGVVRGWPYAVSRQCKTIVPSVRSSFLVHGNLVCPLHGAFCVEQVSAPLGWPSASRTILLME
ncbi:hypothetical protein MPL3356_350078 [Mesorhizobium plurifarium]|uniref:Uncharacterized protein n=1 Tax=Mesorhizobium plurifarium TaxID=69974 RepID=A0A090FR42_MESPL|nr:hypothetical protein MPL3356_350078 [Mesorhizobium plurifarium]